MDIARLKELRAIGVREYEQEGENFRVVFDERVPAPEQPKKAEPPRAPHRQALVALKGIPNLDPDRTDPRGGDNAA